MGGGKSYKIPAPSAPTPPAPSTPSEKVTATETPATTEKSSSGGGASEDNKSQVAAQLTVSGRSPTILSGALGDVSQAKVAGKTLLGE